MIIDLILDRRAGDDYNPRDFYFSVMQYGRTWPDIVFPIARAMDEGTEEDIKRELCKYVKEQGYNPNICKYIKSVNWL